MLVVRVHPELLAARSCRPRWSPSRSGRSATRTSATFERYLARNGVLIRKFFLHVSKEEQKKRFLERLDNPDKNWKFSMADAKERGLLGRLQAAYEDMIRATATKHAPWYVVPADNKWFTRVVVAAAIIDALGSLDLKFPVVDDEKKKEPAARLARAGVTAGLPGAWPALFLQSLPLRRGGSAPAGTPTPRSPQRVDLPARSRQAEGRAAAVPFRRLLVGVSDAENASLVERLADDLQPDRQAVPREAAGHGNGRQAEDVEGHGIAWAQHRVLGRRSQDRRWRRPARSA